MHMFMYKFRLCGICQLGTCSGGNFIFRWKHTGKLCIFDGQNDVLSIKNDIFK